MAISTIFAVNGALLGTWAPRIPEVQKRLGIGDGTLGIVLFALAAGSLTAMPVAGWFMQRWGSTRVLRLSAVTACLLPAGVGAGHGLAVIWTALFVWGVALGAMDVAMNAQAVAVGRAADRPVINGIHACFSVGSLLGAAIGAGAAALAVPLAVHLSGLGVLGLVCCLRSLPRASLAATASDPGTDSLVGNSDGRSSQVLAFTVLCTSAYAAMFAEGASADWSAVRLKESGVSDGAAGLGYVAFALTMLLGRFSGDAVARRMGQGRMALAAVIVGAVGSAVGFSSSGALPVIFSFGSLGLGLSCLMPYLFTVAGNVGSSAHVAVTAVSTSGYVGLLSGPGVIGWLAELSSVAKALWILPVLLLIGSLPAVLRTARGK
ncbi:MFS transporter [Kitasatospora sp. NPDC001603]|uniref:MFS transporter n=1 Tax=Kitasatospora sp. NPDC001603 TaxID=3154388 RepID=UPI00331B3232